MCHGYILTLSSKIVGCKVLRRLEWEVVDQPAVTERAVGDIGNSQLFGRVDQAICFVQRLKGRVFGLDGINRGDCNHVSTCLLTRANQLTSVGLSQGGSRTLGQSNVFRLAGPADLIQSGNRLFEGCVCTC